MEVEYTTGRWIGFLWIVEVRPSQIDDGVNWDDDVCRVPREDGDTTTHHIFDIVALAYLLVVLFDGVFPYFLWSLCNLCSFSCWDRLQGVWNRCWSQMSDLRN